MLKANRILYPKGIAIQAKQFARYIESKDTRLVTVGQERYRVYRYEGPSMASMTRWCCWLGRRISRWRRNIFIAS
ncbi:Uncharacterised protein [[Flavobacterium] thermophilum]|nr:Uncharacterised protein [[Flavobacterium] thermophilum]